jgi:hypothetical protein
MLVRITRTSMSPKEPVRNATTAAPAAQQRPVTSAMPARRRMVVAFASTVPYFGTTVEEP